MLKNLCLVCLCREYVLPLYAGHVLAIASCESGSVVGLACRDEKRIHLGASVYATEFLGRFRQLPNPVSRSSSAFSNSVCSSSSSGRGGSGAIARMGVVS